MLRSKSCRNCAAGNAKCRAPCVFSTMQQSDYNAVRNHLGREMFRRHLENIEATASHEKNRMRRALIGASKWWSKDPIEGTFGEINRRREEQRLISQILVEMCKAISGTTARYKEAEYLARELAPDHPVRLSVAVAYSVHHGSRLEYQQAIRIAQAAIRASSTAPQPLIEEAAELHNMLSAKVAFWEAERAGNRP